MIDLVLGKLNWTRLTISLVSMFDYPLDTNEFAHVGLPAPTLKLTLFFIRAKPLTLIGETSLFTLRHPVSQLIHHLFIPIYHPHIISIFTLGLWNWIKIDRLRRASIFWIAIWHRLLETYLTHIHLTALIQLQKNNDLC